MIDYFKNHSKVGLFPWSVYHRPLEDSLLNFFKDHTVDPNKTYEVLIVGCGLLHELQRLPRNIKITICDIDARVLQKSESLSDPRIFQRVLIKDALQFGELSDSSFDVIYGKEVIEHTSNPELFLKSLNSKLKPDGVAWFSTPNYGEPWLPIIEFTFLEIIAWFQGFSRWNLHPSKFSVKKINLLAQKLQLKNLKISVLPFRFSLCFSFSKV
jgi:2-polyprenyl-3-methyl-5-hydroxy-6-metoxy-1,4-benzoquinol methylase